MTMRSARRIGVGSAAALGLAAVAAAIVVGVGLANAGCEHVVAGPDDCWVCQRYYLIGDDMCYENYYYCVNTETGAIDGDFFDRCEPW